MNKNELVKRLQVLSENVYEELKEMRDILSEVAPEELEKMKIYWASHFIGMNEVFQKLEQ